METYAKTDLNLNPTDDPPPDVESEEAPAPGTEPAIEHPVVEPTQLPLDEVVQHINAIYVRKGLEVILEVGRFVLDTLYDGDRDVVADRVKDHPTFRALAERNDLLMSHISIWRAVRVVLQLPALPAEAATRLPYTHHTMLLPVRDEATKADLAQLALDEGLSSRQFEEWVKEARLKEKTDKRGGRTPLPAFVKTVRKVRKLVDDDGLWGDLDAIEGLEAAEAEALYEAISGMKLKCEQLQDALRHKVPGLDDAE